MIPVLYDDLPGLFPSGSSQSNKEAIVKANIPSHMIAYLPETMSCKVTEERNGQYELILTYPMSGKQFERIYPGQCVMVKANQIDDPQLFRIYKISKVLRGILTVYARHISYDLCGVDYYKQYSRLAPAPAPQGWLEVFTNGTNFVGKSNISTTGQVVPGPAIASVKSFLGGMEGSVLDTFHGEYHWDNFVVNLDSARGSDKGIIIQYGKNLTEMTLTEDDETDYTGVRGFARYTSGDQEQIKVADEIPTIVSQGYKWTKILDVTESLGLDSGVVPTNAQIEAAVEAWLDQLTIGNSTLEVQVTEPSKYATLGLCDTVKVVHERLAVTQKMKVIGVEYDSLLEKYTKITMGEPTGNLAATVNDIGVAVEALQNERPVYSANGSTVDLSGGNVYISDGTYTTKLTAGIGRRVHNNGSEQSLSSGTTMQNLTDFELTKGTWLVTISVRFASNATGRRAINMADTSGGSAINAFWGNGSAAVNGAYTYLRLASTVRVTDATHTYYVNGYQNSGSSLNVTAAYDAVRIY